MAVQWQLKVGPDHGTHLGPVQLVSLQAMHGEHRGLDTYFELFVA